MTEGPIAAVSVIARKWYGVVTGPRTFFATVNDEERGQRAALLFFGAVLLVGRAPLLADREPLAAAAVVALLVLLSPAVLHVATAVLYLSLWPLVDEDRGVDRTLRAVAYGSAPGIVGVVPKLGVVGFVGGYLIAVGVVEGHETSMRRAAIATVPTALLVFGIVFGGFEDGIAVWRDLGI